jgi:hypothetical protein
VHSALSVRFCEGDRLTLQGSCPTNLDGGMLAGSWTGTAQLTLKVIEAVRQLRRVNGPRQVPDAELGAGHQRRQRRAACRADGAGPRMRA